MRFILYMYIRQFVLWLSSLKSWNAFSVGMAFACGLILAFMLISFISGAIPFTPAQALTVVLVTLSLIGNIILARSIK